MNRERVVTSFGRSSNWMTIPHDRPRPYSVFVLYGWLAVAWLAFAGWVVPPLLTAEHPGRAVSIVKRYIKSFTSPFIAPDIIDRWRQFAAAVLIALVLHLTIVLLIRRYDLGATRGKSSTDVRPGRRASVLLIVLSLAFLAVTLGCGPIHDYFFYLNMWYEVRQGHDPWYLVPAVDGSVPLNAYGPLFNVLAGLEWLNPLAPKLLFAYAYILFCVWQFKEFGSSHRFTATRTIALTALFWNPFPWVEIAITGHFDILVAMLCLGAIRARMLGGDFSSAACLALGVLLKFFPAVLLPFLAIERGRVRWRFLIVAVAAIALGAGLSYFLWGKSTLTPLTFAATRSSNCLSIFCFLRKHYSPLLWFTPHPNLDHLAPIILFVALLRAWSWYRLRHPEIEAACVIAVTTTALFYQTGFPQYHMLPFALGAAWAVRYWDVARGRIARVVTIACYFGWLATFDIYYIVIRNVSFLDYPMIESIVGLPTFVIGCAFLASVAWSAWPKSTGYSGDNHGECGARTI